MPGQRCLSALVPATLAMVCVAGCTAIAGYAPLEFTDAEVPSAEASTDTPQREVAIVAPDAPDEADAVVPARDASIDREAGDAPPGPCDGARGPAMRKVDGYCVDSTEVTNADYELFLASNGPAAAAGYAACLWKESYMPDAWPRPAAEARRPVVEVDWCDAWAYCAWAGKRLCGRIGGGASVGTALIDPTQDQWYRACSYAGQRLYPYDGISSVACNDTDVLADVGSRPTCEGGYPGLFDLSGNAKEWVDSCTASGEPEGDKCRVRGGPLDLCLQSVTRDRDHRDEATGFRCCSR